MSRRIKNIARCCLSRHRNEHQPVLIFASPRGGSTWATELVFSQPGFSMVSEPLNVRREICSRELSTIRFSDLNGDSAWKRIEPYYARLLAGQVPEFRALPGNRFYRFQANRSVFKQNQGAGDLLKQLEDRFAFKIIHLLRHPIAVALSREVHPLLYEYENSPLRDYFSQEENKYADSIIASGGHLEKGVLAWCLHHTPALRMSRDSWLTLYYEATVLQPDETIKVLSKFLGAEDVAAMRRSLMTPSNVTRKSTAFTQELLKSGANRERLVTKWRDQVSESQEHELMEILNTFSCEAYRAGSFLPSK